MSLPQKFIEYTRTLMGEDMFKHFSDAIGEDAPVSIRVNRTKCGSVESLGLCEDYDSTEAETNSVPWCADGYYLPARPAFTFDPRLHAGWYYVQEASSMFIARVLQTHVDRAVNVLDMCAAPGGKSTAAISVLPEGSTLLANEPVRTRANILAENLQKWGNPNVIVTNNYPKDIANSRLTFDVIICDVPCSGEGMFRKDEGAIAEWSTDNVASCSQLQREIVAEAWKCLRPGGLLIYSTCTFNAHEDEENVQWICDTYGAEPLEVKTFEGENITGSLVEDIKLPVYRFIPGLTKGEGLFMAVLRKADNSLSVEDFKHNTHGGKALKSGNKKALSPTLPNIKAQLSKPEDFDFIDNGKTVVATPKAIAAQYAVANAKLRTIHAGITMGERKGKDIVPSQSLALSTALAEGAFHEVEVDYDTAIAYLRKEAVALPHDAPLGFVLITHGGARLGFAKNIGNRANNLYPQEWKIKSTYIPTNK